MNDWRTDLGSFFEKQNKSRAERQLSDIEKFVKNVVVPAFDDLKPELEKYGRAVNVRSSASTATLFVQNMGTDEFTYCVQGRTFPDRIVPFAEIVCKERKGVRLIRTESMFRGDNEYTIDSIEKDEVIQHFLSNYMDRVGL